MRKKLLFIWLLIVCSLCSTEYVFAIGNCENIWIETKPCIEQGYLVKEPMRNPALQRFVDEKKEYCKYKQLDGLYGEATKDIDNKKFDAAMSKLKCSARAGYGSLNSIHVIGFMFLNGLGVEQSDEKAIEWFKEAASRGNKYSKDQLTSMGVK